MPVKGTKALEAVKSTVIITEYTTGAPVAPATGHLSVYVDLAAANQHRELETHLRLQELIDRAREDNYNRLSGASTVYYTMSLEDCKQDIRKTIDTAARDLYYFPVDGSTISFIINDYIYEPEDGTTIAFVDGGASEDTITDSAEGFLEAGFVAGDSIVVAGSTSQDGTYVPTDVAAGVLTFATGTLSASEAGIADITFTVVKADTIEDSAGGFLNDDFVAGLDVEITDSTSNDGTYEIASITAGLITLVVGDPLVVAEVGVTGMNFHSTVNAVAVGDLAIGVNTGVLSGSRGSTFLDACWKQIIESMGEQHRLTA